MTLELADVGAWLLQRAATFPDTIVTKQLAAERGWFERVAAVASGLVSISLLVLTAALAPAALTFRKRYQKINDLIDRVYGDIQPLVHQGRTVVENASVITTTLRGEVATLAATLRLTHDRVTELVARGERRLVELDALLDVAQHEAETLFVSTASAVRGARAGARAFRDPGDEPIDGGDERPGELEEEEEHDGEHSAHEAGFWRAAPRIRPRRGSGRLP